MKYVYKLEDLDCAHCAAKIEKAIGKITGVESVSVNFLSQKLTIEAEENKIDDIMNKAVEVCRKVEPDCRIILK